LLGLLARALTGMRAIWPQVGGVSVCAIAVACTAGRFRRKREEQEARRISDSPHAADVMPMPD
jgi:hypothetical protein